MTLSCQHAGRPPLTLDWHVWIMGGLQHNCSCYIRQAKLTLERTEPCSLAPTSLPRTRGVEDLQRRLLLLQRMPCTTRCASRGSSACAAGAGCILDMHSDACICMPTAHCKSVYMGPGSFAAQTWHKAWILLTTVSRLAPPFALHHRPALLGIIPALSACSFR